jgi:hypothetical protein
MLCPQHAASGPLARAGRSGPGAPSAASLTAPLPRASRAFSQSALASLTRSSASARDVAVQSASERGGAAIVRRGPHWRAGEADAALGMGLGWLQDTVPIQPSTPTLPSAPTLPSVLMHDSQAQAGAGTMRTRRRCTTMCARWHSGLWGLGQGSRVPAPAHHQPLSQCAGQCDLCNISRPAQPQLRPCPPTRRQRHRRPPPAACTPTPLLAPRPPHRR